MTASFLTYLHFISNKLGGDVLPLNQNCTDPQKLVSQRAIDYDLMRMIVTEIGHHNAVFQINDCVEAFATLDALGAVRGGLFKRKGDVGQISLIDRIGELTVNFFNLEPKKRFGREKDA